MFDFDKPMKTAFVWSKVNMDEASPMARGRTYNGLSINCCSSAKGNEHKPNFVLAECPTEHMEVGLDPLRCFISLLFSTYSLSNQGTLEALELKSESSQRPNCTAVSSIPILQL